jgi:hypothetical protein
VGVLELNGIGRCRRSESCREWNTVAHFNTLLCTLKLIRTHCFVYLRFHLCSVIRVTARSIASLLMNENRSSFRRLKVAKLVAAIG